MRRCRGCSEAEAVKSFLQFFTDRFLAGGKPAWLKRAAVLLALLLVLPFAEALLLKPLLALTTGLVQKGAAAIRVGGEPGTAVPAI